MYLFKYNSAVFSVPSVIVFRRTSSSADLRAPCAQRGARDTDEDRRTHSHATHFTDHTRSFIDRAVHMRTALLLIDRVSLEAEEKYLGKYHDMYFGASKVTAQFQLNGIALHPVSRRIHQNFSNFRAML